MAIPKIRWLGLLGLRHGFVRKAGDDAATAAYTKVTNGVQTLVRPANIDRIVLVQSNVVTVFANGDGAQPTFTIGETGTAAKFAAAAEFTGAAAGTKKIFAGTLAAGKALIVTAVAGTGTTETGDVTITAIAYPAMA